jgi:hypothetical protein
MPCLPPFNARQDFDAYMNMHEYQNIQTRMLGADSHPYRNVQVTVGVYMAAVDALDNLFFVGLQEVYELSVQLMLRELQMEHLYHPTHKERDNTGDKSVAAAKAAILKNESAVNKLRQVNRWDANLYRLAVDRFCATIRKHLDLHQQLEALDTAIRC